MNRIVITHIEHNHSNYMAYMALDENRKLQQLQVFEPEEKTLLDQIYVGYVEKIVPNIHAAFVRIADGQKCYLSLTDVTAPVYTHKPSKKKGICEGDELLVQVIKDAVKTKDPVVSTKLTIHGHYCFLSTENTRLGVSKKIPSEPSEKLECLAADLCPDHEQKGYGLVFRTNAASVSTAVLTEDVREVQRAYDNLLQTGVHATQGQLLYRNLPGYLTRLKTEPFANVDQVLTDDPKCYQEIAEFLPQLVKDGKLKQYQDDAVSLSTLYHLRGTMEELLAQRVWLPSGANIIIECLETLTVIDVNSGKNQSRRPETLFAINVEAAKEIARQLRLRNISGMILVDFINIKKKEQQQELISVIKNALKEDSVPANFIDITKLGLVELTRKKVYKSLREILE